MPIQPKLTEEQKQTLREMLEKGCGYAQCSAFFGNLISRQRCKQYAQKWGIDSKTIRGQKTDALLDREKTKKWGAQWRDKEWLKSEVYQAMREKFRAKKHNAVNRGVEFSISFGELEFPTHCPILGIELDYFAEGRQENSPSFDRFDSSKGYVSGNVAVVSWRANRIKNDGTAEEHRKIADWMSKNQ